MSTDEESRAHPESRDATDDTTSPHVDGGAGAPSDDTLAALRDIEAKPLPERASGYQALADRLHEELEESDPSRGAN